MNARRSLFVVLLNFLVSLTLSELLEDYVFDESDKALVGYDLLNVELFQTYTTYTLNITTLKWIDEKFSDRPIWWHILLINVPKKKGSTDQAVLYIDSGDNVQPNVSFNQHVSKITQKFNCITATLGQNPNMPIRFYADSDGQQVNETEIIAWTWTYYIEHHTERDVWKVPILMPMTKAIVRTLDIIEMFAENHNIRIPKGFILAGISKRAWAIWLAAAVDSTRVTGMISIVYDMLNISASFHTQYKSFGGAFSYEFESFFKKSVTSHFNTPQAYSLYRLLDPIYFIDRLRNKKILVVVSTGDEYMMLDNVSNFWKRLSSYSNKNCYLRRIANTDHFLEGRYEDVLNTVAMFMNSIMHPILFKLPQVEWEIVNNKTHASIELSLSNLYSIKSIQLSVYEATTLNKTRRDFRLNQYDAKNSKIVQQKVHWNETVILAMKTLHLFTSHFQYTHSSVRQNEDRYWRGFYVEIKMHHRLDLSSKYPVYFSTETNIVPETFPATADCHRKECII